MKKIIGLTLAFILVSMMSFAQVTTLKNEVNTEKTKTCIPTKACAKKAGMTLAECKKTCKGSAAVNGSTTSVASASKVAETIEGKKKCCSSIKKCAAKAGMTVAECKAKCKMNSKTANKTEDSDTRVAAAVLVNEIEEIPQEKPLKKKCCKGASACTKKKS